LNDGATGIGQIMQFFIERVTEAPMMREGISL